MDREEFEKLQALNKTQKVDINLGTDFQDAVGAEEAPKMQFGFDVVEVQRVGLQPGDVLMVTVKNDDLSQESVDGLRSQLQIVFPGNKVFVFAMGTSDDVQLAVVSQAVGESYGCNTPAGYCEDCNCGKKESKLRPSPIELSPEDQAFLKELDKADAEDEHMKNLAKQGDNL